MEDVRGGDRVEQILERVIEGITARPVSVAVLGSEISVNIGGVQHRFDMEDILEPQ